QVAATQAVGNSGTSSSADNLLLNDQTSQFNVTFDRPIQVSTFTPDQVLSIVGPVGPVTGPQYFTSGALGLTIPAATATASGVRDAPLTIPSFNGTFQAAKVTVQLNIAFPTDSALSAALIAPDGTKVQLFSGLVTNNSDFINTVLDDD